MFDEQKRIDNFYELLKTFTELVGTSEDAKTASSYEVGTFHKALDGSCWLVVEHEGSNRFLCVQGSTKAEGNFSKIGPHMLPSEWSLNSKPVSALFVSTDVDEASSGNVTGGSENV